MIRFFASFLYMITLKVDSECIELFFNMTFTDLYSIVYLKSNTIINYLWRFAFQYIYFTIKYDIKIFEDFYVHVFP